MKGSGKGWLVLKPSHDEPSATREDEAGNRQDDRDKCDHLAITELELVGSTRLGLFGHDFLLVWVKACPRRLKVLAKANKRLALSNAAATVLMTASRPTAAARMPSQASLSTSSRFRLGCGMCHSILLGCWVGNHLVFRLDSGFRYY